MHITIIMYHSVNKAPDVCTITPEAFYRQVEFIHDHFAILRLKDIHKAMAVQESSRKVVITFDDAFTDFHDSVFPVLEEFRMPSTVFVPTGFIGKFNDWDFPFDKCHKKAVMDVPQLRELQETKWVDFGSHSVDHKKMSKLSVEEMRRQMAVSRSTLEDLLSTSVTMFAYPYGRLGEFSSLTEQILSESGYEIGVTNHWGTRNSPRDILCLRRISLREKDSMKTIRQKIEGLYDGIALLKAWIMFGLRSLKKEALV